MLLIPGLASKTQPTYPHETRRGRTPTRNLPKRHQSSYVQSAQTTSIVLRAICPNETVGAVPVCPPERPHSGVSIPKTHALCAGMNDGCAPAGRHGRAHRRRPYQSPPNHAECYYLITLYIRQFTPTTRCAHPPPYCTFDSSKPRVLS